MNKIFLTNLSVKITPAKAKKHSTSTNKLVKHLVKGYVILEDGVYRCVTKYEEDNKDHILDFTDNSFNLKGKTDIFTKEKDKTGHYLRIIRSKESAKVHFASPEVYAPFAPEWIINGYIVSINGTKKFEFNSLIARKGHEYDSHLDYE